MKAWQEVARLQQQQRLHALEVAGLVTTGLLRRCFQVQTQLCYKKSNILVPEQYCT
jgi:hypothetical protein